MTRILRILISAAENGTSAVEAPPQPPAWLQSNFVVISLSLLCVLGGVAFLVLVWAKLRQCLGAGNSGLKNEVLQSLPRFAYVDSDPTKWVATPECAICLAEFAGGDEIRVLHQCGHGFHVGCIDTWLGSHSSCPSCRQVLAVGGGGSGSGESRETSVAVMQCLVFLITIIEIALFIFVIAIAVTSSLNKPF